MLSPKIINVRDKQVEETPVGGFGWRKVLRFRAREGSPARDAGLDFFYLLFNFTSADPKFPQDTHAGQIQAILVPIYPTAGKHRDAYFLVSESLGAPTNPEKVGFFLRATFDLVNIVPVLTRKQDIIDRVTNGSMPQDREIDETTKGKILQFLEQLK